MPNVSKRSTHYRHQALIDFYSVKQQYKTITYIYIDLPIMCWVLLEHTRTVAIYRHVTRSVNLYSIYPITLEGRRGTTDEFATIPFHLVLFTAALVKLAKSIPVHSLIMSSHLFFCPPLSFSFHCALQDCLCLTRTP